MSRDKVDVRGRLYSDEAAHAIIRPLLSTQNNKGKDRWLEISVGSASPVSALQKQAGKLRYQARLFDGGYAGAKLYLRMVYNRNLRRLVAAVGSRIIFNCVHISSL